MNKSKYITALAALCLSTSISAQAATTDAPGVVDRDVPTIEIPSEFSLDKEPKAPIRPAPEVEAADDKTIIANIKKVTFTGAGSVSEEKLQEIAATYLNRDITARDLAKLKFELTSFYYEEGFILVKAVTPEQNLSSGVLNIEVYEAKIGSVSVEDKDNLLNDFISDGIAARLSTGEVFDETDVESMISDFNNLNGMGAVLNLRKGAKFGQTDLVVSPYAANEDEQSVSIDNYGSPLTGEVVVTGHLEVSNLAHLGEKIFTTVRRSDGDLWSVAVGGETPIGFRNVKLKLDYLHSENEIADRLAFQQSSGETDLLSVALTSDIINVAKERLTITAGLSARKHQTFSDITGAKVTTAEDDIRQAYIQKTYLNRQDDAVYYANLKLIKGLDVLGADNNGVGRSDPNGDAEAWRLQPTLFVNVQSPVSNGQFKATASGQLSSDRLLSSDLFAIGGYGSVRGFDPATETGESGYSFSVEYVHDMPDLGNFGVKIGPFVDGAAVYNRGVAAIDSHLYSAGIGAEFEGELIPDSITVVRLDWARPLGNYQSSLVDNDQFLFRVAQKF